MTFVYISSPKASAMVMPAFGGSGELSAYCVPGKQHRNPVAHSTLQDAVPPAARAAPSSGNVAIQVCEPPTSGQVLGT